MATYSDWLGKPVVLHIKIRQCPVPVSCHIVEETDTHLRIHLEPGWHLNVEKELVIKLEEVEQRSKEIL